MEEDRQQRSHAMQRGDADSENVNEPIVSNVSWYRRPWVTSYRLIASFFRLIDSLIRDIRFLSCGIRALRTLKALTKEKRTLWDCLEENVSRHPDKLCLRVDNGDWTFKQVRDYSEWIGWFVGRHLQPGDVAALMLPNCAEFGCIWLGLSRYGVVSALINTNLRQKPLKHSLSVSKPKVIIYSRQYSAALEDVLSELEDNVDLYCLEDSGGVKGSVYLKSADILVSVPDIKKPAWKSESVNDVLLYIYTSGTTGLPKAAKVTTSRLFSLVMSAKYVIQVKDDDVLHCALPLYHTAGTTVLACTFFLGLTMVLRPKFTASGFIRECRNYNATVAIYIGEMIRYLVDSEVQPGEKDHQLRAVFGNGLRGDVWKRFQKRFNVTKIIEYYGSTEGNFLLVNINGEVGCCGFLPLSIPGYHLRGPSLIRVDQDTGIPIRSASTGLCQLAPSGEPGLCIGYCPAGNDLRKFHGYLSQKDSQSKIIMNVFKEGDMAFNTGDLMIRDDNGNVTFIDRLGDTFRWKGENVSTSEVESVLRSCKNPKVVDCAVFGVQIPGSEGRAGMAALVLEEETSTLSELYNFIVSNLPSYACPIFVRLVPSLDYTSTCKVIKSQLQAQGYNPSIITHPLFIRQGAAYVRLTPSIHTQLEQRSLRL